jgi:hypothetical protein
MKFDINNLTDTILDYMDKNVVKNPEEFATFAFYKFVEKSGLSDFVNLRLTTGDDEKLKIMQLTSGFISNYLDIVIKDPAISDPADAPENKPLNSRGPVSSYDNIKLNSDESLEKKIVIKRENKTQGSLDKILTNEMKDKKINIYKVLSQYDTLSDISNNLDEYETMIHLGDRKLYELSQAIYSYREYQDSLLKNKTSDKNLENVLNSLISLSTKNVQPSARHYTNVDKLADIIRGDVSFSVQSLLLGSDTFKNPGFNKNVTLTDENLQNIDLGSSVLNTIKVNADKGTFDNIIDDIYKNHISADFKSEFSLKLKLTTRQKTLEDRLENEDLNNFIEFAKIKFPSVFKDDELFSYKSGVFDDKNNYHNIAQVFNTFKLNDGKTEDCVLSSYTDTFLIEHQDLYRITKDERYIRLIGETDASVKSMVTGVIENVNDYNEDMKMLKVYSLLFLNKEDNQYNEMGLNDLFSYCAKNKLALYVNMENPQDDSVFILKKTLMKVAENFKDSVIFIDTPLETDLVTKMRNCKTDMPTFIRQSKLDDINNIQKIKNKIN